MPSPSISQEPPNLLDLRCLLPIDSLVARFPFFPIASSSVPLTSTYLYRRPPSLAALPGGASSPLSSKLNRLWSEFNRFLRIHCERRASIGFASLGVSSGEIRLDDEGPSVVEEDGAPVNGVVECQRPKKVLILMSDTGGGHRASAEAIKAAFNQEFGEEYQVTLLVVMFHRLVTRCYCPSTEVAKRALKAGLQPSQIKVFGLPVRPSFVKPVRPKAGPGTIAEAMIRGLPIILNDYIAGQVGLLPFQ
ncbi:hypothetical protein B296_00019327 [Ensete ventricosum]|uniref:Diacylglycerol glucosyltransferase N-terminal domain-containing protein n=1 Tax=Ensete ventricosum TaxID=4639 RepID=A0A427ACT8_ENSVE|nr:hypothetical protein B296_00019327 [Ensete ventricosum]